VGNIDPTYFWDDPSATGYVLWKEDGNDPAHYEPETPIWGQAVSSDGLSFVGQRTLLLENDNTTWEGPLVEGPWLVHIGPYYYLFYSANVYDTPLYALGVARASSPMGPFEKNPSNPIVASNAHWVGPGHCSVLAVDDTAAGPYFLLYHAWAPGAVGGSNNRLLLLDSLQITADGWPQLLDKTAPSWTPQALP
jgi:arabinan endo-1,5-alpha-L-arabinosidase